MNQMASMRKSVCSGASSAVRFCKSRRSSGNCGVPVDCGAIGSRSTTSQTCSIPKVSNNIASRSSAFSPSRFSETSAPFSKCHTSGPLPGGRCFASQIARLPGEVGVTLSLIPYYSAIADSRLVSRLATSGDAPILQGTLTHIDPDL